ncbi:DUF6817 domain-containing protein [Micromonospora sp. IBSANI012]|uniref:DUF6817 domain-containing protein n=1 Tax=Micromonospora sp. IBSANI012 TaxID=3457761 RepID=UPI004059B39B
MSIDAGARSWLRRRGAEAIDHPGGTLYGHLCRVQERLAALGSDVATQLAGLTHAVYGTDGFDLALLDRSPPRRSPATRSGSWTGNTRSRARAGVRLTRIADYGQRKGPGHPAGPLSINSHTTV